MSPSGNILAFPDRSPIEEEAARWVVRIDTGNLSSAERAQFEAWKQANPAHLEALERMSGHWNDLDVLAALSDTPSEKPVLSRPAIWAGIGLVASLVVGVFIGVSVLGSPAASLVADAPTPGLYKTKVGDQEKVVLADGSIVTLNTASRIEARINSHERTVRLLEGEAFFEVAHDSTRPFRVYAGDGVTVAIGTAFSVRLNKRTVDVVVSEGRVAYSRVEDNAEPETIAYVGAGETAQFGDSVVIDRVDNDAIDRKLSWTEGKLVFSGDPLSSVVADIARYTNIEFTFASQDLADMRVGGVFGLGEVDDMLEALETNFDVRVEHVGDKLVRVSRKHP